MEATQLRLEPYRPRLLYTSVFIWISLTGGRFLAPFLEHQAGFDDVWIGITLAVQTAISTFAGSHGGAVADRRERVHPGKGRSQVMAMGLTIATFVFLLHAVAQYLPKYVHILLRALYAIGTSFVSPVLDGITLDYLERTESPKSAYGRERLFGAISWAVANLILAPLLDRFGFGILYPLGILAYMGVLTTLYIYTQSQLQMQRALVHQNSELQSQLSSKDEDANGNRSSTQDSTELSFLFRLLVQSGAKFLFCFICLASGQAIVDNLVFLFFEFLGSTYTVMGWTVVLTVSFEIPIFHVAPWLLERYGASSLLILACICYVVRVIGYTLVPKGHVLYVLLLEPLHGVTYACSQTAAVHYVAHLMPKGMEASGQGLLGLFRGVGSILGLSLGGWSESVVGPKVMYRCSAGVVTLGMAVFASTFWMSGNQNHRLVSQIDSMDTHRDESDDLVASRELNELEFSTLQLASD